MGNPTLDAPKTAKVPANCIQGTKAQCTQKERSPKRAKQGRKGIIFSIIYAAIFMSIFSMATYFADDAARNERAIGNIKQTDRTSAVLDDLAGDFSAIVGFNASASKSNGNTTLTFQDALPTAYGLSGNITQYEEFINWTGNYSRQLNYNVSADYSAFRTTPRVYVESADLVFGLNYSWNSLSKTQADIAGTTQMAAGVMLNVSGTIDTCNTSGGWSSGAMPAAVVIKNSDGTTACSVGTAVNPASTNIVWANTTAGGWLTISIGTISGTANSTRISLNSVSAVATVNHTLRGLQAFAVRAPVSANLSRGAVYSPSLVLLRK